MSDTSRSAWTVCASDTLELEERGHASAVIRSGLGRVDFDDHDLVALQPLGDLDEAALAEAGRDWHLGDLAAVVEVDDAHVTASYANFCRVTGSPEELIIDFGLNPQPVGMPKNPIAVTQRCIVNYYTAKRLLHALSLSVQRHEAVFGVLETDIQKRVKPLAR